MLEGPVCTKRHCQCCDDARDTVSLITVESLQNGLQPHSQVTPLWSMRALSQASRIVDATLHGVNEPYLNDVRESKNIRRYPINGIAHRVKRYVFDDVVPTRAFLDNGVIDKQGILPLSAIQAKTLQIQ